MHPTLVLSALAMGLVAASDPTQDAGTPRMGFDAHYAFFRPEPRPDASSHSYYPADHDFTDYSQHITRTTYVSKNSAASLPPSGPFFAHEIKIRERLAQPSHQSWNTIEPSGPHKRPHFDPYANYGPEFRRPPVRPHNRPPIKRKKQKKRPQVGRPSDHPNDLEKVAVGAQSIASAYPNSVMGTLSLLAGVVWYLVNKSATPVVKMRSRDQDGSDADSSAQDAPPLDMKLASLLIHLPKVYEKHGGSWNADCQKRATCEIFSVYSNTVLGSLNRWTQKMYKSSVIQKMVQMGHNGQLVAWNDLFQAAADGHEGADCSVVYGACPIPFPVLMEARDR